jgi:hypothetical protein
MVSKTWDFTLNNYTPGEVSTFQSWSEEVSKMVVSKELSESGTPHLQGRITFKRAYRLKALRKQVPRAHWEPTKATADSLYCKKVDSEVILDVNNRKQGQRSELSDAVDTIKSGVSVKKLWEEHPLTMVKFHRGLMQARKYLAPKPVHVKYDRDSFSEPLVDFDELHTGRGKSVILVGPPNIGKTEFAKAHFERPLFVTHKDNLGDFDPEHHDGIIFDDMDFSHWPRSSQIHLIDVDNPRTLDIKYGTATIPQGVRKIFTCNFDNIFSLNDEAISTRLHILRVDEFLILK